MRCLRAINNLSHTNGSTHHFARNIDINYFFKVKVVKSDRLVMFSNNLKIWLRDVFI